MRRTQITFFILVGLLLYMLTAFTVANPDTYLAKTIPIDNICSSTLKEDAYQILVAT